MKIMFSFQGLISIQNYSASFMDIKADKKDNFSFWDKKIISVWNESREAEYTGWSFVH